MSSAHTGFGRKPPPRFNPRVDGEDLVGPVGRGWWPDGGPRSVFALIEFLRAGAQREVSVMVLFHA